MSCGGGVMCYDERQVDKRCITAMNCRLKNCSVGGKDVMSDLYISMYHYTRDLKHSRYPEIKGLDARLFREQIERVATAIPLALDGGLR